MGKASFFLGEAGQGAKMKLVVNMIMGSMMAAFSEGLALADKVRGGWGGLTVDMHAPADDGCNRQGWPRRPTRRGALSKCTQMR